MSYMERILAMANHVLESAKNRPGQIRRPNPNTRELGSSGLYEFSGWTLPFPGDVATERNRSGLNISGSGKYFSSRIIALK